VAESRAQSRRTRIGIVGDGLLATAVAATLRGQAEPVRRDGTVPPPDLTAVIDVSGTDRALSGPVPWLPVSIDAGTAFIGPLTTPGTPGCARCVASRRRKARPSAPRFADGHRPGEGGEGRVTAVAADVIARLAVAEVLPEPRHRDSLIEVRTDTLDIRVHRYLPEPACTECGGLPADDRAAARITLGPRPKPTSRTYRIRDLSDDLDRLVATYVDSETGLIRAINRHPTCTFPTSSAPVALTADASVSESGYGRALNFRRSEITAIAEAVERYGGSQPHAKRTVIRGSYRALAQDALDPGTLGLYPEDRYSRPGFPYQRYHDGLELSWVWGYSFHHARPVLVPECYAYYRLAHCDPANRPFVYEISNGCALGGCLEEAILHGIVELAERDSFLLTWLARRPAPLLDLGSAVDRRVPLMAERMEHDLGCRIYAFNITAEHGIPAVWTMAVRPGEEASLPKAFCAAGSGFVPEQAIISGLQELAPSVEWWLERYPEEAARAAGMVADPEQVVTMQDHTLVNAHIDAFPRFSFLLCNTQAVPIAESFADSFQPSHRDLSDDLRTTVQRYLDRGQDVIVVNQTTQEHRAGNFSCVKVIIPGLLPMTFGHRARRVDGLPRLMRVPCELGFASSTLRPEDINPHPHPFP
jgi:ribosomal protein S12 methylthiotransferase accessory factor